MIKVGVAQLIASEVFSFLFLTVIRRVKQPSMKGKKIKTRVHLVTLSMSFPSCLLQGPHAIACEDQVLFPQSIGQITVDVKLCQSPLLFMGLSGAWWASMNRCRKSVLQMRHVDVSPILLGPRHLRDEMISAFAARACHKVQATNQIKPPTLIFGRTLPTLFTSRLL